MTEIAERAPEPLTVVQNAWSMDLLTFCLHMNHRHNDAQALHLNPRHMNSYVEECWRIYHDRLHDVLESYHEPLDHRHGH